MTMHSKKVTIEQLKELDEKQLMEDVVIPLWKDWEAEDIQVWNAREECGIDLYVEKMQKLFMGRFGIQVVKKDILCEEYPEKNEDVIELCRQIKKAMTKEIIADSDRGKIATHITVYYIFTSGDISIVVENFVKSWALKRKLYVHLVGAREIADTVNNLIDLGPWEKRPEKQS